MGCTQWCLRMHYLPELQLKVEHTGTHTTFLNLDITEKDKVSIYKFFQKRDTFLFFMVCMLYIGSNIPKSIFYSTIVGEFFRKAFIKNLWNCIIEWKHKELNPSGVKKHYPKSFKDLKKKSFEILEEILSVLHI